MSSFHSDLPIIRLDPPRRSMRERYGSLFYLGLAGLVVLVLLIGRFALGVWSLREVWAGVYVLNDPRRTNDERIEAAHALSRDPRVTQRQRWDLCLRRSLPGLARYLLAESLTTEAAAPDLDGYAVAVARSEGWPDWLRLLLVRPLAYGAGDGLSIPEGPLEELRSRGDPILGLWASYTLAVSRNDPEAAGTLDREAAGDGPHRELAGLLRAASRVKGPDRSRLLDRATLWLRSHHPQASRLWDGWEDRGGRLVRKPASDLPLSPSAPPGAPPRASLEPKAT